MSKFMSFDFYCEPCGAMFEDFVKPDILETACPKCSTTAKRQLSAPRLDHSRMALCESASPESIKHFEHTRTQRRALEEKRFREHGDYGPAAGAD